MRTIGIDLAIVGDHKAVILDDQGNAVGKVFCLRTDPARRVMRMPLGGAPEYFVLRSVSTETVLRCKARRGYRSRTLNCSAGRGVKVRCDDGH